MSLRTKLIFSTVLEVLLVLFVSGLLISSSIQARDSSRKEARAAEIVKAITEIRFVTFENLLHHDERSFEQWQNKHNSLSGLLKPSPTQTPEERALMDSIAQNSQDVDTIFRRLVSSYKDTASADTLGSHNEFQDRLATQLLTKQQAQVSSSLQLAKIAREQATAVRQRFARRVGVAIFIMLLIMAVNFFYITATITKALTVFQKGATRIANGDFNYRINVGKRRDEIGQLGAAFNSMAASLRQIDKVKSEFILLASHQLRTPLTAIKWMAEELRSPTIQLTEEKQANYIKQIEASNQRMINLVDELLDATKVGLGTLPVNPQPIQLTQVLEQVIQDLSLQIHNNKTKLIKEIDRDLTEVLIDPTWAHIIFQNLVGNAIKYSPKNQEVKVVIQNQQDNMLVSVIDNGCGIPKNQHDKIFGKLFRADNARTMVGEGSGLGLYITKAMVEQSGGSISFTSIEGKGSTFYVKLPFIRPNK